MAGQIHDANEYVILIRLDSTNLFVEYDGRSIGVLDPDYVLGPTFTVRVVGDGSVPFRLVNGGSSVAVPGAPHPPTRRHPLS